MSDAQLLVKQRQLAFDAGGENDVAVKDERQLVAQIQKVGYDDANIGKEDNRAVATDDRTVLAIIGVLTFAYVVLKTNAVGL